MKLYLGTSGFYYDHWRDRFYPPDLHKRKWLEFYCKHFNTIEMNVTFYRFPSEKMLKSWYKRTPQDFKLTFKANRLITHRKRFEGTENLVKRFCSLLDFVKEKLACILWQVPPSLHFSDENMELLDSFLSSLDKKKKNVVEFRHKSWWNEKAYDLLKKHKVSFCVVSAPGLPEDFVVTSDVAYVRFHGIENWYRYDYSKEELKEWAERIKRAKAKEVFCYFNNDYEAYAVKNCKELKGMLR